MPRPFNKGVAKDDAYDMAEKGYLPKGIVLILLKIERLTFRKYKVEEKELNGYPYIKWPEVCDIVPGSLLKMYSLPAIPLQAFKHGLELMKTGLTPKKTVPRCNDPNPTTGAVCILSVHHKGDHKCERGIKWAGQSQSYHDHLKKLHTTPTKRALQFQQKQFMKLKLKNSAEQVAYMQSLDPDVPDPSHDGPPHTHPMKSFLGRTLKLNSSAFNNLPVWNKRLPNYEVVKKHKWRTNRNPDLNDTPDWWMGEYITPFTELCVRWSKIIWAPEKVPELPKYGEASKLDGSVIPQAESDQYLVKPKTNE